MQRKEPSCAAAEADEPPERPRRSSHRHRSRTSVFPLSGFVICTLAIPSACAFIPLSPQLSSPRPSLHQLRARQGGATASGIGFGAETKVVKKKKPKSARSDSSKAVHGGFRFSGGLRPGKLSPRREVPREIPRPDYVGGLPPVKNILGWIPQKSPEEIEGMRRAGRIAREVLDIAGRAVQPGVTTDEIDALVHEAAIERNAYPSPLGYRGFPKSVCTSANEVICHGIPDSTVLCEGDIVNVDVTTYFEGFHGDCSETFLVGSPDGVDEEGRRLVKVTYDAWQEAIKLCKPGTPYKNIGKTIYEYVRSYGYDSTPGFCGHGIGRMFHDQPEIHHVPNSVRGEMRPGHTFTIEPMINEGSGEYITWPDQWTVTTKDGKRSAQFEHTILITDDGVGHELLTGKIESSPKYWWEGTGYDVEPVRT
ncbi:unnamed protein product [Vitrella brassicaformis CCMP3155]|uniref:Methionine aminopeptidase n=2 Tax=Vitrella brassicaformis TaxID=1169539 RepID=A0A0G4GWF6_VITBC|nr:unnamed protein product [Vitrella brassicaformis CCMP3155]|eukprot:CEM35075.1 unnamed protein product [Vitrella brassicaformis CCMP3155]